MYKLSPSDFAYLYEECKLCYYLKVVHNIYQPSMPMPGVFSAINTQIQGSLVGKNLKSLSDTLPEGNIVSQEGWVESIVVPQTSVYIKGKYDLLLENPDKTYSLIDLKISTPDDGKAEKYKTQLSAYKFALENPRRGSAITISKTALLIFYPESVSFENGIAKLDFPPTWLEIKPDMDQFHGFMKEIDQFLKEPPPKESNNCKWCNYRHIGEELTHEDSVKQGEIPF